MAKKERDVAERDSARRQVEEVLQYRRALAGEAQLEARVEQV